MVGTAGRANNTIPPSVALLAFAAVQAGLLIAAEPAVSRLLAGARLWQAVTWLNGRVLTVYLWHMVPVVVVAVALYPTGVLGQPVPTMLMPNGPQASRPPRVTAPPAASAQGRQRQRAGPRRVRVPSCQANPHWCIVPQTSR